MCFTPFGLNPDRPYGSNIGYDSRNFTGILLGVGAGAAMDFVQDYLALLWTFITPGPTAFVYTPFIYWRYSTETVGSCYLFYSRILKVLLQLC